MIDRIKDYCVNTFKEVNKCSNKESVIVILCGVLAVWWPLAGIIIWLISKKTKFKTYGKVALIASLLRIFAFGFSYGITYLVNN